MSSTIILLVTALPVYAAVVTLFVLIVRALLKYIHSGDVNVRKGNNQVARSLGEVLKENRLRCNMTQELVAERVGVSRQAVSKWERGASEPSTTSLLKLAKLFDVPVEELLKGIE